MDRRAFLASAASCIGIALAGCTSDSGDTQREQGQPGDDGSSDGGSSTGEDESGGDNPVELLSHEWYNRGQFDTGVTGQVENVSDSELTYVEVSATFMDSEGVQFEESLANVSDLAAGRVWEFEAMFLGDDPSRVDTYEVALDWNSY